jgi:hypothetical protein
MQWRDHVCVLVRCSKIQVGVGLALTSFHDATGPGLAMKALERKLWPRL